MRALTLVFGHPNAFPQFLRNFSKTLIVWLLWASMAWKAPGQIFVAYAGNYNPLNFGRNGGVGEYSLSGATINPQLISGFYTAWGLTMDQNGNLWVGDREVQGIAEYTPSGSMVCANDWLSAPCFNAMGLALDGQGHLFVSCNDGEINQYATSDASSLGHFLLPFPGSTGLAVSGNNLFIADSMDGAITVYTTSGAVVNDPLITGLQSPMGIALDGNGHLFVADSGDGRIGEYTISGGTVNASLIVGLDNPQDVALDGQGHLFVSSGGVSGGVIGEYTISGEPINAALITGLPGPGEIVVVPVPEPSVAVFALLGLLWIGRTVRKAALH